MAVLESTENHFWWIQPWKPIHSMPTALPGTACACCAAIPNVVNHSVGIALILKQCPCISGNRIWCRNEINLKTVSAPHVTSFSSVISKWIQDKINSANNTARDNVEF